MVDKPDRDPEKAAPPGTERPSGPLESLFQEAVRRATGIGVTGLAATSKAFEEHAPAEWMRFFSEQSGELRGELLDRLATEFGEFLRSAELQKALRGALENYELEVTVKLRADPRKEVPEPRVEVRRRDP